MVERVHQIAQHVEDMDRAVEFYRNVMGLPLLARFDPPGLAFFDVGNVRLLLEAGAPAGLIYLEVSDLDATHARLGDAGVELVGEPHMIHRDDAGTFGAPGTEEWMAFLRDSEGNLVGLVERRPPPP